MSLEEWYGRHRAQLATGERDQARLVLLGDSITQMWADAEAYSELLPYRPLNLGIGGDQTQHVLWRLEQGCLRNVSPLVVVLLIGVNNLGNGHEPTEAARGILAVLEAVCAEHPSARVLLLAILPTGAAASEPMRHRAAQTNQLLAQAALPENVAFHDVGSHFIESDGTIDASVMADGLHPTPLGFERLTRAVEPLIATAFSVSRPR